MDWKQNLQFRREIIRFGYSSAVNSAKVRAMCAMDLLFFVNVFGWTADPRAVGDTPKFMPFICYDYQVAAFREMHHAIWFQRDLAIPKSRDMGASWLAVALFLHQWLFVKGFFGQMVSRKKDLVDSSGDPMALFWKLDFFLERLPGFLIPPYGRTDMHLENFNNGSTIDGESTNTEAGRGGRFTAVVMDEADLMPNLDHILQANADATECRFLISTMKSRGAFWNLLRRTRTCYLYWWKHPGKRRGLYRAGKDGKVEFLDKNYQHDPEYNFILDGRVRSVWYDATEKRRGSRQAMAAEVDIDPAGAGNPFFDTAIIEDLLENQVRPPLMRGEIDFSDNTGAYLGFRETTTGAWRFWQKPDSGFNWPTDRRYAMGIDVSAGTGASNSAIMVVDVKTGLKIAEFVHAGMRPDQMAPLAIAAGRWFAGAANEAFMIWETGGTGRNFGDKVIEMGYRNIYAQNKKTKVYGWHQTKDLKFQLLSDFRTALFKRDFIDYSEESLLECAQYSYSSTGGVEYLGGGSDLISEAQDIHGDRVIASALAWIGMKNVLGRYKEIGQLADNKIEPGSMGWRMRQRELAAVTANDEDRVPGL